MTLKRESLLSGDGLLPGGPEWEIRIEDDGHAHFYVGDEKTARMYMPPVQEIAKPQFSLTVEQLDALVVEVALSDIPKDCAFAIRNDGKGNVKYYAYGEEIK